MTFVFCKKTGAIPTGFTIEKMDTKENVSMPINEVGSSYIIISGGVAK